MEIKTKTARHDNYSKGARKLSDIKYIVIHYTGNKGDTAKNNADYFAREYTNQTSAHYFVDENETWQSVPDACVAWHCGTRGKYYHPACRNANSLGVEICMNDKQGKVRQGSIDRAARLVRELMQIYSVPADHVIRHYDVTHKECPAPMVSNPALWQAFKTKLTETEEIEMTYKTLNDVPAWGKPAVQAAMNKTGIDGNKILSGTGGGNIDLTETDLRAIVREYRCGLYK